MVEGEEFMQNRTCARCDSYSNVRRLTLHWYCIARSSQYTLEERLHAGGGGETRKERKKEKNCMLEVEEEGHLYLIIG